MFCHTHLSRQVWMTDVRSHLSAPASVAIRLHACRLHMPLPPVVHTCLHHLSLAVLLAYVFLGCYRSCHAICQDTEGCQMQQTAGLPRVLAVGNSKGGVYKTSITASIGGLCAEAGMRVLLVDLDPQGNLTEDLGLEEVTDEGESTFDALRRGGALVPRPSGRTNLDVVCGGEALADAEQLLPQRGGGAGTEWQHSLANSLDPIVDDYDLVVLDCPPRSPNLTVMAVVAARYVLIPTKPDKGSRKGMVGMARLFVTARERNPDLDLLGVVLTGIGTQATAIRAEVRDTVEDTLQGVAPVMNTVIRYSLSLSYNVREHGQLPHEIERSASDVEPWWKRLRDRATEGEQASISQGGSRRSVRLPKVSSVAGVAQDYADLTSEVLDAIADREDSGTSTPVEEVQQ